MKKKEEEVGPLVQKLVRHLVKKGTITLDKRDIEKIAGEKAELIKSQLDALMESDGCYCPDPPGGCRC